MVQCYDSWKREYTNCGSQMGAYIAVGIIVPVIILIIIIVIGLYRRYRVRRYQRDHQQISMNTVVPIYNSDELQQAPYNYSYPPHYTAATSFEFLEKPPSYEQTVHQLSEIPPTTDSAAAILPVTTVTSSSQSIPPSRNGP